MVPTQSSMALAFTSLPLNGSGAKVNAIAFTLAPEGAPHGHG